jgi:transposase
MRQIRELMRLRFGADKASSRVIAGRLGIGRTTVVDYLERIAAAGLGWPLPDDLTDIVLEERLFGRAFQASNRLGARDKVEPDWAKLAQELKKPAVNLQILHEEYRQVHPEGYGYSRFCELFRSFEKKLSPVMRQRHPAGEKLFVDYSGKKVDIIDPKTGEIHAAELFVGVLGASSLTYAELTWTQSLPDWIGSHVRMLNWLGKCPKLFVPDNLKSAVHKPSFFDPQINLTYGRMADHYEIGVLPARPYRPRDKAKAEAGVRIAQTYILGRLRHQRFFSLDEANQAIRSAVDRINDHVMRRLGATRRQVFELIDAPAMRDLPAEPYEYAEWKKARVHIDYHVELKGYYYSVPYSLIGQEVEGRVTERMVEILHRGQRIAVHARRYGLSDRHATETAHMPSSHRRYASWSQARFRHEAGEIGPNASALIDAVLTKRRHPEQGFRTCMGILNRLRGVEHDKAEATCARAIEIGALTTKSIASILDNNLFTKPRRRAEAELPLLHANIRGGRYYMN